MITTKSDLVAKAKEFVDGWRKYETDNDKSLSDSIMIEVLADFMAEEVVPKIDFKAVVKIAAFGACTCLQSKELCCDSSCKELD